MHLLFPKNPEGRTTLLWEVNKMFWASNAPLRKQKHVLAYYLKKEIPQTNKTPLPLLLTHYILI